MVTENTSGVSYEKALQLWGAKRLSERRNNVEVDTDTVRVEFEFREGFDCCGGTDPTCYCSFAESPSADVIISGAATSGETFVHYVDATDFDFAEVLREIVVAAGGTIVA